MKTKETVLQRSKEEAAVVKEETGMDNNMAAVESIMLINTKTLQKMLGCCYSTAVKIGMEANARVEIKGIVRWRVNKIAAYLDGLQEAGKEAQA